MFFTLMLLSARGRITLEYQAVLSESTAFSLFS
jgi:hypothetical protein